LPNTSYKVEVPESAGDTRGQTGRVNYAGITLYAVCSGELKQQYRGKCFQFPRMAPNILLENGAKKQKKGKI